MKTACVILAAGLGTRMKSRLPKVLHGIFGRPMIEYVIDAALGIKPEKIVVVVGEKGRAVEEAAKKHPTVVFAVQKRQLGTAHALSCGISKLKGFGGTVVVMNGDTPLLKSSTLKKFLGAHKRSRNSLSVLGFVAADPTSYGRIIRTGGLRIVEERDATDRERSIKEVNSGLYAMGPEAVALLKKVRINKSKGEYYLTDVIGLSVAGGYKTGAFVIGREDEFMGVNTRDDLARAQETLRRSVVDGLVEKGVRFVDRDAVYIEPSVRVGTATLVYPNVYIEGRTVIGRHCKVYPNSRVVDSTIGDSVIIKDSTVIEESVIRNGASIGPFAHARPGTIIDRGAKIGNFVEIKKSRIGEGTKAMHLSYIGDAEVGKRVNVGAGTITCNYDGKHKYKTVIQDDVFIGSDTQLVAPVKVSRGAYVGAGTTVTKDVPPLSLAMTRVEQRNIEKWVERRKKMDIPKKGEPES